MFSIKYWWVGAKWGVSRGMCQIAKCCARAKMTQGYLVHACVCESDGHSVKVRSRMLCSYEVLLTE